MLRLFPVWLLIVAAAPAASFELSAQPGWQAHADGGAGAHGSDATWDGRADELPLAYGVRSTWWRSETLGFGLEFSHAGTGASAPADGAGFGRREPGDGADIVTANVMRRFPGAGRNWTPYLGGGVGIATSAQDGRTGSNSMFGFETSAPAARWTAGVNVGLGDSWSVFGEYQGLYAPDEAARNSGRPAERDGVTNAVNLGVSFDF